MAHLDQRLKQQIALLAGEDLPDEEARAVRERVLSCPDCRDYWLSLRGSIHVLHETAPRTVPQPSLWQDLEAKLAPPVVRAGVPERSAWIPSFSVAAACLALLAVAEFKNQPQSGIEPWAAQGISPLSVIPASPASFSPRQFDAPAPNSSRDQRLADWQSWPIERHWLVPQQNEARSEAPTWVELPLNR